MSLGKVTGSPVQPLSNGRPSATYETIEQRKSERPDIQQTEEEQLILLYRYPPPGTFYPLTLEQLGKELEKDPRSVKKIEKEALRKYDLEPASGIDRSKEFRKLEYQNGIPKGLQCIEAPPDAPETFPALLRERLEETDERGKKVVTYLNELELEVIRRRFLVESPQPFVDIASALKKDQRTIERVQMRTLNKVSAVSPKNWPRIRKEVIAPEPMEPKSKEKPTSALKQPTGFDLSKYPILSATKDLVKERKPVFGDQLERLEELVLDLRFALGRFRKPYGLIAVVAELNRRDASRHFDTVNVLSIQKRALDKLRLSEPTPEELRRMFS